jgi:hypothetical protein
MELKRRTPEEREAYLLDQIVNLQSALAAATEERERLSGELALERVSNVRMPIKRVEQTTPRNCGQACLAMVLEVPIDEVPKEASAEFWDANAVQEWLSDWGLQEIRVRCLDQSIWPASDVRCIVDGPSPRGEKLHAVVCTMQGPQGWVLDADPHPDNNGLADEPYSATFFAVKNPAEFIRLQSQLAAKDAMLAAATRFTYGRVTIRYEDDAKKWMVWKNGQSLTDDWFISHDEAYQAALAGGWLEPKNERGGG